MEIDGEKDSLKPKNEYNPLTDQYWWTPFGFFRRLRHGRLMQLLVNNTTVTVADVDSIVNIYALVDALVLTIPIAAITATKYSDWDNYQDLVESCTSYPDGWSYTKEYDPSSYYNIQFQIVADCALCTIYCTLLCLMLTVVYYLSRPAEDNVNAHSSLVDGNTKKMLPHLPAAKRASTRSEEKESEANDSFRLWWRRGRIMLLFILVSTIAATISLMFVVNIYYQTFFSFSDEFCSGTPARNRKFKFGYIFLLVVLLICFYIVV